MYSVLRTQYSVLSADNHSYPPAMPPYLCALVLAILAGCSAPADPNAELNLAAQIAQVRNGTTDRIQIEQSPLTDADLEQLADLTTLRELLIDHEESRITACRHQVPRRSAEAGPSADPRPGH